jgi:hypothetical protein
MAAIKRFPIDKWTLLAADFDDTSTSATKDGAGLQTITLVDTPSRGTDLLGDDSSNCLTINGTSEYAKIPATFLTPFPKAITFLLVCKPSGYTNGMRLFSKLNTAGTQVLDLYVDAGQKFAMRCMSDAGITALTSTVTATVGTTYRIGISVGAKGLSFYINGSKVADASGRAWIPPVIASNGEQFPIGGYCASSTFSNFFAGDIDAFRVYSREMTDPELAAYTAGNAPSVIPEAVLWKEVVGNGQPFIAPTQAAHVNSVYEASMQIQTPGVYFTTTPVIGMTFTGGYSSPRMWYAEWNGVDAPRLSDGPILGGGVGGEAGLVCRGEWSKWGTTDFVTYVTAAGAGAALKYATSTTGILNLAAAGTLIPDDEVANYDGYANASKPMLIGSTYYMLVEAHTTATGKWVVMLFKADSLTQSPWEFVHVCASLQVSTGSVSGPDWEVIGSNILLRYHVSRTSVLPSYMWKASIPVADIETDTWTQSTDTPIHSFIYGSTWDVEQSSDVNVIEFQGRSYRAYEMGDDTNQKFGIMLETYQGSLSRVSSGLAPAPNIRNNLIVIPGGA